MTAITGARVYRFYDTVAINFEVGDRFTETVYVEPDMAMNLAIMIQDAAEDIGKCPHFSASKLGTYHTVPCTDGAMSSRIEKE